MHETVDRINTSLRLPARWPWAACAAALAFYAAGALKAAALGLTFFVGCVGLALWLAYHDRRRRTTTVLYRLDGAATANLAAAQRALDVVARSDQLWLVDGEQHVADPAENWGVPTRYRTRRAHVSRIQPPFVKTNVDVLGVDAGTTTLMLMPGALFVWHRGRYAAVPYQDLVVDAGTVQVSAVGAVPADARVVRTAWLHTRRDNGPGARFRANTEARVVQYGQLVFSSAEGLRIVLHASDVGLAERTAAALAEVGRMHAKLSANGASAARPSADALPALLVNAITAAPQDLGTGEPPGAVTRDAFGSPPAWADVKRWAWFCQACGHRNGPGCQCAACGADPFAQRDPLASTPCGRCGAARAATAAYCQGCGVPFPSA